MFIEIIKLYNYGAKDYMIASQLNVSLLVVILVLEKYEG